MLQWITQICTTEKNTQTHQVCTSRLTQIVFVRSLGSMSSDAKKAFYKLSHKNSQEYLFSCPSIMPIIWQQALLTNRKYETRNAFPKGSWQFYTLVLLVCWFQWIFSLLELITPFPLTSDITVLDFWGN